MSKTPRSWKRRTTRLLLFTVAVLVALLIAYETGLVEQRVGRIVVHRIEQATGGHVELGAFHLRLLPLRAELDDFTLHGREGPGVRPLFRAARVEVGIHIVSIFKRQFSLDELSIDQPHVRVEFQKDGRSNLPTPAIQTGNRPWRDTLFDLRIGRLELHDGSALINDKRIPLSLEGRDLEFQLRYDAPAAGAALYLVHLDWKQVRLTERHDLPFTFDFSTKFTLSRDSFELDDFVLRLPHSEFNVRAELPSFARPDDWNLHYRCRFSLADVQTILRKPATPDAITDFSGQASHANGEWIGNGHFSGHDVRLRYEWFHAGGMEAWGDYLIARRQLTVPKLGVRAFGGSLNGSLQMSFDKLAFRTETHFRGADLDAIFSALENKDFPVKTLHWDAHLDLDSVNTWEGAFQHFHSNGETRWSPLAETKRGRIPMTARIEYDYAQDRRGVILGPSLITAPKTRLEMQGTLGAADNSALRVNLHTDDLLDWDEFINTIRGKDSEPQEVAGDVDWRGQILGPIVGPVFSGHLRAIDARYGRLQFKQVEGDMEYSPDDFRLTKATIQTGRTSGTLDLALQLNGDWSFDPGDTFALETHIQHAPAEDIQNLLGVKYPITALLSGDFRGSGTHAHPVFDSNFIFEDINAKGVHFDVFTGQLHLAHDEIRLWPAELRRGKGHAAGNLLIHPQQLTAEYDISGSDIPLEDLGLFQKSSLPLSALVDFHVHASGPIFAPSGQGSLRLINVRSGSDVEGELAAQLTSDGQSVRIALASLLTVGKLEGQVVIGLAPDHPVSGRLAVEQVDMNAFIVSGLHLRQLTGHSSVDGVFTISGALRQPDMIEIDADIARISFDYELVQLHNDGNIRLAYRRNEVRIEQAHLSGPNTDLQLSGSARFDHDRPLHLVLSGGINMRLLAGFIPQLEANGRSDVNVTLEGNMSRPRVTGRVQIRDASANYADFPVGLSHVNGDLVFDRSHLVFDRVTAESGGGQLTLGGNVTYGDEQLRYEITAATSTVRIRYPAGMSWLAGGSLQLSGTSKAGLLTGRVDVKRLLLGQGVDAASFFAAASQTATAPTTTSPFLRNLAFDVEGQTSPGARIEWTGAELDIDGNVRLRGTWDRPVLLGHIHLLGGQMAFRGNTFTLTRGDINFANPFQLDPELNVEATSTISQYQVTITFSGRASKLSLNYRSDPPLPDSDIVSLLALGSTGEESALRSGGGAGSQNYGATALLSEAISSGLGGRIERLFGISHFRVDPFLAGTATEANAAARITVEQQVTRDLTITYSSNASTTNQYQLIQVEYELKRDLSVVFLRDVNGTYGFDVKFVHHFK